MACHCTLTTLYYLNHYIIIFLLTESPTLLLPLLSVVTPDMTAISALATKVNGFDLVYNIKNVKLQQYAKHYTHLVHVDNIMYNI